MVFSCAFLHYSKLSCEGLNTEVEVVSAHLVTLTLTTVQCHRVLVSPRHLRLGFLFLVDIGDLWLYQLRLSTVPAVSLKEPGHGLVDVRGGGIAGQVVVVVWIDLYLVQHSGSRQRLHQLSTVLKVHVVYNTDTMQ